MDNEHLKLEEVKKALIDLGFHYDWDIMAQRHLWCKEKGKYTYIIRNMCIGLQIGYMDEAIGYYTFNVRVRTENPWYEYDKYMFGLYKRRTVFDSSNHDIVSIDKFLGNINDIKDALYDMDSIIKYDAGQSYYTPING